MEFRRPAPLSKANARGMLAAARHDRRTRPLLAVLLIAIALWAVRAEQRRADAASGAWSPHTDAWVAAANLEAGHLLEAHDIVHRALPPAALPVDAVREPPLGRRLTDAVGRNEVLREGRIDGRGSSANASQVGSGRGAVSLTQPTPHIQLGDRVDLYEPVTGAIVASGAEVIAVIDEIAVVAVVDHMLDDVIRAFISGDVVPVLVG